VLAGLPDVASAVTRPGGVVELALRGDAEAAARVLATAVKRGVKLASFAPAASDLEELFLQITDVDPKAARAPEAQA
jgi:hypothetical protein